MKPFFILVVIGHGLIHLMGPAKAFGFAELPHLTQSISRVMAIVWLLAAAALLATAGTILVWPRWWWVVATVAVVLSQAAILSLWRDAKYGTIVNVAILVGALIGYLSNQTAHSYFVREVSTRGLTAQTIGIVPVREGHINANEQ